MHGMQFNHARFDSLSRKLTPSIAMEQKRFDLRIRTLSGALSNRWLLLVIIVIILAKLTTQINTV